MSQSSLPAQGAKRFLLTFLKASLAIAVGIAAIYSWIEYLDWSAARESQRFCRQVALGSDVSLSIIRFEKEIGFIKKEGGKMSIRHYGFPHEAFPKGSHTFSFPGFLMNSAVCELVLDDNGRVITKRSSVAAE